MSTLLDTIVVVLVEPRSPGNIGMVCRAMKNMGLSRLRLVAGCDHQHPDATMFAVSARNLLEQAECYPTLSAALADTTVSVATTRRTGKYRQELLTPPQVAHSLLQRGDGTAALVFGREDHGLSTEELSLCSIQATIPSSEDCGSLNLAQSVLIFCYELFNVIQADHLKQQRETAPSGELESLFGHLEGTLARIGFLNPQNPAHMMRSLRRIFFRSELDSREVTILRGMLSQVDWATEGFGGRKKSS
ncbi:MAG: RNA methyltransferase [Trichlorobacter sp.]|jgi:tRNA/rRNA methyltransferase